MLLYFVLDFPRLERHCQNLKVNMDVLHRFLGFCEANGRSLMPARGHLIMNLVLGGKNDNHLLL